jgi:GH25 family lysozyme M1 (1,4-beta-N-acetylmuramidase)
MVTLGIDVSAWQTPASISWARLRELGYSFAYVRGVKMGRELDVHAPEHVKRARDAGFRVGLYTFFDPRHSADQHIELTEDAHAACGVRVGDLAPALDLESITGGPQACRDWVAPAFAILESFDALYRSALRYHNVYDWHAIGRPAGLERWPLWLADYTPPADLPCVIWQQRAAPIACHSGAPLDQNAALGELPTIGPRPAVMAVVEPSTLPIPWPRYDAREHDLVRNAHVARDTEEGRHG